MERERKDRHDEIASFLDGEIKEKDAEIKTEPDETPIIESIPKKKKGKTRKGNSMYEEFRGGDGKIDYNLAYRKKKGGVDFGTLSKEEKKRIAFEKGTKLMYLQCPVCYGTRPLVVKLDQDGNHLKKHEDGIEYKMVDGVLQRRFCGPGDDYLPLTAKFTYGCYGQHVKVEESMAISTLKRLDADLFNDFKKALERSMFKFQ
jgi:hypothetical protein